MTSPEPGNSKTNPVELHDRPDSNTPSPLASPLPSIPQAIQRAHVEIPPSASSALGTNRSGPRSVARRLQMHMPCIGTYRTHCLGARGAAGSRKRCRQSFICSMHGVSAMNPRFCSKPSGPLAGAPLIAAPRTIVSMRVCWPKPCEA